MNGKRFLATWGLVALMGLLVGLAGGDGVLGATQDIPTINYLRFDYDYLDRLVVHWAGHWDPDAAGSFTLTGDVGPLICRGIVDDSDCDCRLDDSDDPLWMGCYFDTASPFMIRPCECLVALWWEDDTGFHHLASYAGRCRQSIFLPVVTR